MSQRDYDTANTAKVNIAPNAQYDTDAKEYTELPSVTRATPIKRLHEMLQINGNEIQEQENRIDEARRKIEDHRRWANILTGAIETHPDNGPQAMPSTRGPGY